MAETSTASRSSGGIRRLVIVESPTKARKIAGYLGPNYVVESSRGHIRDLPRGAADVPAKYKGCLLYTSPSPRDATLSRMPSSA